VWVWVWVCESRAAVHARKQSRAEEGRGEERRGKARDRDKRGWSGGAVAEDGGRRRGEGCLKTDCPAVWPVPHPPLLHATLACPVPCCAVLRPAPQLPPELENFGRVPPPGAEAAK
jgi:hypothetical protein